MPVVVGERSILSNFVTLYEGVKVGSDCFLDDRVRIGYDSTLGDRTRVEYAAFVCDRVTIGDDSVVAGFVGDAVRIGSHCIVMGKLVHELSQPGAAWGIVEPAPVVHDHCVVGMGSVVVGGVEIGPRSYVAAGATVTRSVPPGHVAVGQNVFVPVAEWPGEKLDRSFFSDA